MKTMFLYVFICFHPESYLVGGLEHVLFSISYMGMS